jgi:hypothetical protein
MDNQMTRPKGRRHPLERLGWGLYVGATVLFLTWVLAGAGGTVLQLIRSAGLPSLFYIVVPPAAYFACFICGLRLAVHGRKKSIQLLRHSGYRLCLNCRYSLLGLGETGVCSECGEQFDQAGLVRGWNRTYTELVSRRETLVDQVG